MAAAAVPIFAQLGASALSAQGNKKAAKGAQPQLPAALQGVVGDASSLIRNRMQRGFPKFGGPQIAPMTPGQGQFLGAGRAGLMDALRTTRNIADTGLDEDSIRLIQESLNPLFQQQKKDLVGDIREGEAAGGRFFSRGAVNQERMGLERLSAKQGEQVMNIAPQVQGLRLSAAGSLPSFLQGGTQALDFPRALEQQGLDKDFAEFLRTQPENAIGLLSTILGGSGAPFFVPPQGTNTMQLFGNQLSSLFSSQGFLNQLRGGDPQFSQGPNQFGPVQE